MAATPSEGATPEPQPQPSAPMPAQASGPTYAPVDETGPVFLDEEANDSNRPEPSSAWQADASRQTGFGGERDRRVSWGGTDGTGQPGGAGAAGQVTADRAPGGEAPADRAPADPRLPAPQDPTGGAPAGHAGRQQPGPRANGLDPGRPPCRARRRQR